MHLLVKLVIKYSKLTKRLFNILNLNVNHIFFMALQC